MVGELPVKRLKLPILKVEAGHQVEVQSLSERVLSFYVHWVGGRSYVCAGERCEVCPEWETRWVGFLLVRLMSGGASYRRFLLELSASTFDHAFGLMRMEGCATWLGQGLALSRAKKRSPLCAEPLGVWDLAGAKPAVDMRVWEAVSTIYSLPIPSEGEDETSWVERCVPRALHLLELARQREVAGK